jgi:hypothetical protein
MNLLYLWMCELDVQIALLNAKIGECQQNKERNAAQMRFVNQTCQVYTYSNRHQDHIEFIAKNYFLLESKNCSRCLLF